MKVYIYEDVEVSSSYHNYGGLVIISDEQPKTHSFEHYDFKVKEYVTKTVELPEPDHVYPIAGNAEPQTFVFPDSGCC